MNSDQKIIREIMSLFEDIDAQTEKFAKETGLKCKKGCGACCNNPDIETTVAELLPLAAHLWAEGLIQKVGTDTSFYESALYKKLVSVPTFCAFYEPDQRNPSKGRCGVYAYRPGLCRLFGFAAHHDKYGKFELVTCKIIRDSQPQVCQRVQEGLNEDLGAPLLGKYFFSVANIDPVHGKTLLPINQAIRLAIEKVGYSLQKVGTDTTFYFKKK